MNPSTDVDLEVATFVVAPSVRVAAALLDPARWPGWWPDLRLAVVEDRGRDGVRWQATGAVVGTAELWLEPVLDGVVVHWFLRGRSRSGDGDREVARQRRRWRSAVLAAKDALERGRPPGVKPDQERAED